MDLKKGPAPDEAGKSSENKGTESGSPEPVNIRISVRNLVEFILRSGDIDRRGGRIDSDAMTLGRNVHRKVQSRGGAGYVAEVALRDTEHFPEDGFSLTVEGRADGIIEKKSGYTIDEIKGMFADVTEFTEPIPVHLAQAKCYAYMLLRKLREDMAAENTDNPQLDTITVQLTYVNFDTEQVRRLKQDFSWEDLKTWYQDLVTRYRKWARYTVSHRQKRQDSIRKMAFPYPYREGQKKLVASVYRTIEQGKKLFIQAPTGSGKTLATVFPALKAVGEDLGGRIFYLTARTITRTVAEDCFRLLKERGLHFSVVTITSREKICPMLPPLKEKDEDAKPPCSPETCPYAKGHFDRVNDTIFRLLEQGEKGGTFHREDILKAAEEDKVCPFELTLDLTDWTDGIICDYNYVFDPSAKFQRFFSGGLKTDSIFLIDEAHNLVDRGRDMYSADLSMEEFSALARLLKRNHTGTDLVKGLENCRKWLEKEKEAFQEENVSQPSSFKRGYGSRYRSISTAGTFPVSLMNLSGRIEKFLEAVHSQEISDQVLGFYFRIQEFSGAMDRFSEKYLLTERIAEDGRFQLRAACVDPSTDLQACMDRGKATILFSATLLPIMYYRNLISARTDDYAIYASSVFDPSKRKVLIGGDVSTRYQDRGPLTYRKIAEYIDKVTSAKDGNYMVFFSSYRMMEDTADAYGEIRKEGTELVLQKSRMSEKEREEFLEKFGKPAENHTLVGFCVMGSFFGEGIDLKGESLIGAIVVGAGIPQVGAERELLKDYFDRKGEDGFFYSYTCPGLAKVLQAAGRVIRTEEDRGVILLIDERFTRRNYREMFPREWADAAYVKLDNIAPVLEQFWKTL